VNQNKKDFDECDEIYATRPDQIPLCQDNYRTQGEKFKKITNAMVGVGAAMLAAGVGLSVGAALTAKKIKKSGEKASSSAPTLTITPMLTQDSMYMGITGTF
jgi:hypothetical protein